MGLGGWFGDTFDSGATQDDVVKARSLNVTRISAVVFPILSGISLALGELSGKAPFNDVSFQKQVILVMIALIAIVAAADIIGRSIATHRAGPLAVLAAPLNATKAQAGKDLPGKVLGMRVADGQAQFLFLSDTSQVTWEAEGDIQLAGS